MIQNVAALLAAFQQKEIEAIQRSGITHAPTIGAQYEGVTGSVLAMMIPVELELQVVSGFVKGIDGSLSGQIDAMLVRGSGTPIPGVRGQYKWPIKDVLAVLEVKKSCLDATWRTLTTNFKASWPCFGRTLKPSRRPMGST